MLKMVDGTGIIGVDMVCPLGGAVSPPQPPNYDKVEVEGVGSLTLPNSLKAPLERVELTGNSVQGENPAPDNPQEIKSAGRFDEASGKYLLDVKVTGENLLSNNPNDWQIGKGISWSTYPNDAIIIYSVINSAVNVINLKSSNAYSFVNNSGEIVIKRMIERDSSGKGIKDHNIRSNKYTFVTNQNTTNIILRVEKIDGTELLSTDIEFIKIMLVEGEVNELTPYEPYTEQFVQIALNEPLRGIGDYKDTITKDGVVRKIYPPYEINLNDLRDGGYSRTNTVMFSVKVQNKTVGYASLKPSILCNILPDCGLQTVNIYNDDKECIAVGGAIVLFRVNKSRLKDISSFEAIKQSFIELMADKKMIVEYALETPVTEPLPESAQQQLQALHSENGVAHVFVDSGEVPCGIKLTYRKEI